MRRGNGAAGEGATPAPYWSTSLQRPTAHKTSPGNIFLAVDRDGDANPCEARITNSCAFVCEWGNRIFFDQLAWSLAPAPRVLASGDKREATGLPGYKLLHRYADFEIETHW